MASYSQKPVEISQEYKQLMDNLKRQRLEDFYTRHPALRRIKDLVRNYGDMVPAVAAGLALTQWGGDIYGDWDNRVRVAVGGALLSAIGSRMKGEGDEGANSFLRNFYAGLAPMAIGLDLYDKLPQPIVNRIFFELGEKLIDVFAIGGALVGEMERRKAVIKEKSEAKQLTPPLENLVE